jgi:cytosine/adenosine deaminase-related metal-dependent hydrolase
MALAACGGSGARADVIEIGDLPDAAAALDAGPPPDAADAASPPDANDAGPSFPADVTPGALARILLVGTVVTPDVTYDGQVLVEGDTITCAAAGASCAGQPGAAGATVIDTHGVIAPGLIDTHNHILFDVFDGDDWLPTKTYANHDGWPAEPRYKAMLDVKQCLEDASQGKPSWCPATYDGAGSLKCELDKFGELKALVAGTTSVVGLPGTSSACFGSVARSIDVAQNDVGSDKVQTSALFPPSKASADGVCTNFASLKTDAYLVHCGEGTDAAALAEFAKLGTASTTAGCLYAPQTVITHGTAFTAAEFTRMATAGMKLTWSPASNVALYGTTTNIPAALDANVTVTLAPDWSMGGSQNLLDEMRFAAAWDHAHFGDRLTAKDIVRMTTGNAAAALALSSRIGAVAVGHLADLMVVPRGPGDPYAAIVAARPRDVRLTMIGGRILYGDASLKVAAPPAPGCEDLDVCGAPKFVCVAEATVTSKLDQTYAQIKAALEAAMLDVDALTAGDGFDFAPLAPLVKCD